MAQDNFKNSLKNMPLPKAPAPKAPVPKAPAPKPKVETPVSGTDKPVQDKSGNKKNILIGILGVLVVAMGIYIATNSNGSENKGTTSSNTASTTPVNNSSTTSTNSGASSSSNTYTRTGSITGDEVIVRSGATTNSGVITYLNRGNQVTILEQVPGKDNTSAILDQDHSVPTYNGQAKLNKGLALKVLEYSGNDAVCQVEITSGTTTIRVPRYKVRYIGGDIWYHVRLNNGTTGYVYGKYLRYN